MPPHSEVSASEKDLAFRPLHALDLKAGTLPWVALAIAVLIIFGINNWLPKPPPKPDPTWARILQDGVVRVGIDPSFPPFETDDGKGHLSGLDIALADELAREWSAQTGTSIRVQYVYTGFDGLYDALIADQFDMILSALPYNPKKTEDVQFSHSYFNGGPLLVARQESVDVNGWTDLAGRRVGVELGSSGDSFARRWQRRLEIDLQEYDTPSEALVALTRGQVDGVLTDAVTLEDFRKANDGVRKIGEPLSDELFVLAVRKTNPTLLAQINAVIDTIKRDGRLEKLQEEWF